MSKINTESLIQSVLVNSEEVPLAIPKDYVDLNNPQTISGQKTFEAVPLLTAELPVGDNSTSMCNTQWVQNELSSSKEHLYQHNFSASVGNGQVNRNVTFTLLNKNSTMTIDEAYTWLINNGYTSNNKLYPADINFLSYATTIDFTVGSGGGIYAKNNEIYLSYMILRMDCTVDQETQVATFSNISYFSGDGYSTGLIFFNVNSVQII